MSRIPVHTLQDAPPDSRAALQQLSTAMGRTLNIHAAMAASPVVIGAYQGIRAAIGEHGTFDARTREAIALAVGNVDDCNYCQAVHTLSARKAGFSLEQTVQIRQGALPGDPKLAAMITLVREAAAGVGAVSDRTWDAARDAGWTRDQLAEAFAYLAVNLFTNYFNHYARTELDVPAAPAIPGS